MNLSHVHLVLKRELLDALRDRRTLISTLVVPVLVIPLITMGFGGMMAFALKKVQREARTEGSTIMVQHADQAPRLEEHLRSTEGLKLIPFEDDFKERIENREVRAVVVVPEALETHISEGGRTEEPVRILYYSGEIRSQAALSLVQNALDTYRGQILTNRLVARSIDPSITDPFQIAEENAASATKVGGNLMGGIIPYLIILLSFVGAWHPATDVTAGEKERGTLETVLTSPIGRLELATGKFLMVALASIVSAIVSLLSFALTLQLPFSLVKAMGRGEQLPFELSWATLTGVVLLLLPLVCLFAGALLSVGLFARTQREAQSYGTPLMLAVIMPGMAAMLPGWELSLPTAWIPVLNVSLLAKQVLIGETDWSLLTWVMTSSIAYALATLVLCSKLFQRESVLFRS